MDHGNAELANIVWDRAWKFFAGCQRVGLCIWECLELTVSVRNSMEMLHWCQNGNAELATRVLDCMSHHISASVFNILLPGRVAQSVGHLTRESGVLGSIPGLATYFCFSFRFFKKGSCQLLT